MKDHIKYDDGMATCLARKGRIPPRRCKICRCGKREGEAKKRLLDNIREDMEEVCSIMKIQGGQLLQ